MMAIFIFRYTFEWWVNLFLTIVFTDNQWDAFVSVILSLDCSRISRHIFLATTTKTNTSGNTLFYTDIMSNKHFLGVFSATYIFNHDNSRFLGNVFIYIYLSYKVYSVIVMVNKRQYILRLWATPGGLLLSALA
jgi:hypothetical protein